MKLITLLAFVIFTLHAKAGTQHELNFKEPKIKHSKVCMESSLPKNLLGLFKEVQK